MANDVFANGREISCKKADGKSICAFPDVCMTPPECPATPPGVPIPYPNTAFAKDTTKGSKKVKISGKEIMLKNKSYFKKSTGDEAGRAKKKGVITSKIQGKVYFTAWSMDVKVEKQNVVRHMDLTTHNHGSQPGNSPPWMYADTITVELSEDCKKEQENFKSKCEKHVSKVKSGKNEGKMKTSTTNRQMCNDEECKSARACILVPKSFGCCDGKTGHHLLPNSLFQVERGNSSTNVEGLTNQYTEQDAPCCCVEGPRQHADAETGEHTEHSLLHEKQAMKFEAIMEEEELTFEKAKKASAEAHTEAIKDEEGKPQCKAECLESQLQNHFDQVTKDEKTTNDIKLQQKNGSTREVFRQGM